MGKTGGQSKSGGSSKKVGRAKAKCERYRNRGTRERNRDKGMQRKLKELQKHHPDKKYKIVIAKSKPDEHRPEVEIKIIRKIK